MPAVSHGGFDLWWGANLTWEGPALSHSTSLSLPSTAATTVILEYLPCTAVQSQQGGRSRREDVMSGNSHLPQPMEVRAAGHPRNSCCTPGLWLCLYSNPCSEFPAALWVSRRRPRLRGTSGPFREGQGYAHTPSYPETQHCSLLCCVDVVVNLV